MNARIHTDDDSRRDDELPHLLLAAGTTETARIDGISAAGADPTLLAHTPAADAELLAFGDVVRAPTVPASPTGCPTPALVTRAARDVLGFEATTVDAGLAVETGAPTVDIKAEPGADVREEVAVPDAGEIASRARQWVRDLPVDRVAVAETVPGGTTTAMAVLEALGERATVSSSLPENPVGRKRTVVAEGLDASDLDPGDCAGDPIAAIRAVGDPVQATVLGLLQGAGDADVTVECWGGTQLLAIAAATRHTGVFDGSARPADESAPSNDGLAGSDDDRAPPHDGPLTVATTSYVADDESAATRALAEDVGVDLRVTDPGFDSFGHDALARFAAGEAKEGVGMGGAMGLAAARGRLQAVRERTATLYETVVAAPNHGGEHRSPSTGESSGS